MDDDLTFGASVWGAAEPVSSLPPQKELSPIPSSESPDANAFDDFDDFGPPAHTDSEALDEDDFGDFGDFGGVEESEMTPAEFGDDMRSFSQQEFTSPIAGPSSYASWEPLRLDPMPARAELEEEIQEILAPLWVDEHIDEFTTDDGIREMEGVSQILVTPTRFVWLPVSAHAAPSDSNIAGTFITHSLNRPHLQNRQTGSGRASAGNTSYPSVYPLTSTKSSLHMPTAKLFPPFKSPQDPCQLRLALDIHPQ